MSDRRTKDPIEALRALPRERAPARDLWPEIESRLSQRTATPRATRPGWWAGAMAASVALAFVAGVLTQGWWSRTSEPLSAGAGQEGAPAMAMQAALDASEREYQAAFREFIPVGYARPRLSPEVVEDIEGAWLTFQQEESALLAALDAHPDDAFLGQQLLALRARQIEFLNQMAGLDQASRRMS